LRVFKINIIPFLFLLLCLSSTAQVNSITGFYASNFKNLGIYETYLKLNADYTFKYEWKGSMNCDIAVGTYKVVNDTILLKYLPSKNDTIYDKHDSAYYTRGKDTLKYNSKSGGPPMDIMHPVAPTIDIDTTGATRHIKHINRYKLSDHIINRPLKYYYKQGKLLDIDNKGKVISIKGLDYSKHRKFLLFGNYYLRLRNYYLKYYGEGCVMFDDDPMRYMIDK
jgi:hypothetical protein